MQIDIIVIQQQQGLNIPTQMKQEKTILNNFIKMREALKKEMKIFHKEIKGKTNKKIKQAKETLEDLKIELVAIKKTPTERIQEMEKSVNKQ